MKLDEMKSFLDNQFGTIYKTIVINGSWGIGKSYFISEYSKDVHAYNISLFGIDSVDDLKYCIAYSINGLDANNHRIMTENDRITINLPFMSIPLPKLYKDFDSIIEDNLNDGKRHILIIDDLERKSDSLSYKEVFGVITELSNIKNLCIIIIVNEQFVSQLSSNDKKIYFDFNEKVIERTYNITCYSDEAVTNICKGLVYEDGRDSLRKAFVGSKLLNLRTLDKTVKYFNSIFPALDMLDISSKNMSKIINCVLALMGTITDINYSSDKKLIPQVNSLFLSNCPNNKEKDQYIINILYDIYMSNDISLIDELEQAFIVKEIVEPEKDLFYCSKEELMERADAFKKDVMDKYNPKYNIFSIINDLERFYDYMKKYNCSNNFTEDEIKDTIKLYVDYYDFSSKTIYETINSLRRVEFSISKEINNFIHDLIVKKYLDFYIDANMEDKELSLISNVENLYGILLDSNLVENIETYEEELNRIIENNFFIPDLNGSIDETIWGCARMIFEKMQCSMYNVLIREKFIECINKLINESTDEGIYRLNSLSEYYHFSLDN